MCMFKVQESLQEEKENMKTIGILKKMYSSVALSGTVLDRQMVE